MSLQVQIVDANDHPSGSATIQEALQNGLYHRIVRVVAEDTEGNVLLQKRSHRVSTYKDCWDHTAGGYVDVGESYEMAAKRELQEEIGIETASLQEVQYYKSQSKNEGKYLNRFNKMYKVAIPRKVKLHARAEEVVELRWFSRTELSRLLSEHPDQVTDGLVDAYKRLYT